MPRRRKQRGFSLLEVLAGMSLFALVASAIGMLATTSMVHTATNRQASMAAMLAQQELEDLRSIAYNNIASRSGVYTVAGQNYNVTTTALDNTPAAGMKRITVIVAWTGPQGAKSYVVDTIFTAVSS
jgi:type II secretion system protein I